MQFVSLHVTYVYCSVQHSVLTVSKRPSERQKCPWASCCNFCINSAFNISHIESSPGHFCHPAHSKLRRAHRRQVLGTSAILLLLLLLLLLPLLRQQSLTFRQPIRAICPSIKPSEKHDSAAAHHSPRFICANLALVRHPLLLLLLHLILRLLTTTTTTTTTTTYPGGLPAPPLLSGV